MRDPKISVAELRRHPEENYTLDRYADIVGCSLETARRHILYGVGKGSCRRRLKAYRLGGRWLTTAQDILDFISVECVSN